MAKAKYFRAKDMVIAALAHMAAQDFTKAGKLMMKASQDPQFPQMVEQMDAEQQQMMQDQQQMMPQQDQQLSALASIVEGMADGVNDIEEMMDDIGAEDFGIDEPDDVGVDAPSATGDIDVDVEDEEGPEVASRGGRQVSAAAVKLGRAQANLAALMRGKKK